MTTIAQVKQKFENVLTIRDDIASVCGILSNKLKTLKDIYADIVKTHSHDEYSFGTDAFYFQNQLIETDFNKLHGMFVDIDNQIYCEYFNLYRMIKDYASKDLTIDKTKRSTNFTIHFEPFKRINSTKHYSILVVKEMHDAITACISEIESYLIARESDLVKDEEQSRQGLNIDNLVYAEMYKNEMMKAKIRMFYQYMNALNTHHNKYYTRLLLKVKMQHGIVNEDINIKQFVGVGNGTSVKEMSRIGIVQERLNNACTIDANETKKIKSYIEYDNLPLARQNMLDGIMSSSGSSSPQSSENLEDIPSNVIINPVLFEPKIVPNSIIDAHTFTKNDIGKRARVDGYNSDGTIVFVGLHIANNTERIGIVFDEPIGRTNGTLQGHTYFKCEENKGLLAVPYKVKLM